MESASIDITQHTDIAEVSLREVRHKPCLEGARLQPCHKSPATTGALAPEGDGRLGHPPELP